MSNHDKEVAGPPQMEENLPLKQDARDECQDLGFQSEDEIYCSCLMETLRHTSTPVTVGFYSPHKIRAHFLMDKITECMLKESIQRKERQKSRLTQVLSYLTLLWSIVFYQPVITEMHHEKKPIKFLFIEFSAWEYACSKQLWAGLIITLCDHIRHCFGPLPLSLYHVVGSRPKSVSGDTQKEWRLKRKTCCITGGLVIILLAGVGLAIAAFLVPGIRDGTVLKYLGSTFTAVSGSGFIIAITPVIKHLIISQKKKIESMTSDEKFTKYLGYRSAVKSEIEVLTSFINYMEVFKRQRLKIVLKITSLDVCNPEQVVGVLNAINMLLSDRDAPFIFILVVDPSDIVSCLEQDSSLTGMANNGYLYLNRTVTLPFSIPEIAIQSKMHCLQEYFRSEEGQILGASTRNMALGMSEAPKRVTVKETQDNINHLASRHIQEAFQCLQNDDDCLYRYVPDDIIQIKRIINTVPITIRLMTQEFLLRTNLCPKEVAIWVVLANQWPCRLSWILQCMKDKLQGSLSKEYLMKKIWDIFMETRAKFYSKHKELENIMALDGDPELFERLLSSDFPFTVEQAKKLLKYTVNLDHSIKCKMGQLQALKTMENYSKSGTDSEKKA